MTFTSIVPQSPYEFISIYGNLIAQISETQKTFPISRIAAGAACTNGGKTVTCTNGNFTSDDVGKRIILVQNDGVTFVGTSGIIQYVSDASTVVCASGLGATISSTDVVIGFDASAQINSALSDAASNGGAGTVFMQPGAYICTSTVFIPDGVILAGPGHSNPIPGRMISNGATLFAGMFGGYLVQVGENDTLTTKGNAQLIGMNIDAAYRANYAIQMGGWGAKTLSCTAMRAVQIAINTAAPGQYVIGNHVCQQGVISGAANLPATGTGISASGSDGYIGQNDIRGWGDGNAGIRIINASYVQIAENHMYRSASSTDACNDIRIFNTGAATIREIIIKDNELDTCFGAPIYVEASGDTGCLIDGLTISNNYALMANGYSTNAFYYTQINISSTAGIRRFNMTNNGGAITAGSSCNWLAMLGQTGALNILSGSIANNNIGQCAKILPTGSTFAGMMNNNTVTPYGGSPIMSNTIGTSSFVGNGTTTAFTIAHSMNVAPSYVNISLQRAVTTNTFSVTSMAASSFTVVFAQPLPTTTIPFAFEATL